MRKGTIFVILCCFIMLISLSYAEEPTVYQEVYYDTVVGVPGHFDSITEAIAHVAENGTLYIGKPIILSSKGIKSLNIRKSMTIKGLDNQQNKISIEDLGIGPVFNLVNISSFHLENIYGVGGDTPVVKGSADYITIKDCRFLNCAPIYTTASRLKEVVLASNEVIGGSVYIQPSVYGAKVTVNNNFFGVSNTGIRGVNLENCEMTVEKNHFKGVSFNVTNGIKSVGWIRHNIFEQDGRKILVNEDNQDLHFQNNKIYKDTGQVYYRGSGSLDFTRNWWGSKEGPKADVIDGNIDHGNWALYEDFRRYQGDPYTWIDLQKAYEQLERDGDTDNWIYDMDKSGRIDLLDLVAITRCISE